MLPEHQRLCSVSAHQRSTHVACLWGQWGITLHSLLQQDKTGKALLSSVVRFSETTPATEGHRFHWESSVSNGHCKPPVDGRMGH